MTNPGNAVRVRARKGGRASVYEANALCQAFSTGILNGNGVTQNTVPDMNVIVEGTSTNPTVVIAANPSGYHIVLDIISRQALTLTKPATGTRISQIVAYTNDLEATTDQADVTGSPSTCGLIVVNGSGSSTPTEAEIRSAISADGGTGAQAAYAVLASVSVASNTSAISSAMITANKSSFGDLDRYYPVGTVYESYNLDTPAKVAAALGGGTWVADGAGQVIVGYDSSQTEFNAVAGKSGGSKTVTLTVNQMPSHNHAIVNGTNGYVAHVNNASVFPSADGKWYESNGDAAMAWGKYVEIPNTGGSQAHNNLQPYDVRYRYRRTA